MIFKKPNVVEFEDGGTKLRYSTCELSFNELREIAIKDMALLVKLVACRSEVKEEEIPLDSHEGQKIMKQHIRDNSCNISYS